GHLRRAPGRADLGVALAPALAELALVLLDLVGVLRVRLGLLRDPLALVGSEGHYFFFFPLLAKTPGCRCRASKIACWMRSTLPVRCSRIARRRLVPSSVFRRLLSTLARLVSRARSLERSPSAVPRRESPVAVSSRRRCKPTSIGCLSMRRFSARWAAAA